MASHSKPGGTPDYFAPELLGNPGLSSSQRAKLREAPEYSALKSMAPKQPILFHWDHGIDYWAFGAMIFYLQTGELLPKFRDEGWNRGWPFPCVRTKMEASRAPITLIELVQKLTYFDKMQRWKGPRVKESKYFDILRDGTAWHDIASRRYAPFRIVHPTPLQPDQGSMIKDHLDMRAAADGASLQELVEALWEYNVLLRNDDVFMPGVHFNPREYLGPADVRS